MTEKKNGPSRKGSRIKHHSKGLYSARMNNSIECVKKGEISSLKPDKIINESIYDCDEKSCSEDDQRNQQSSNLMKFYETNSPFKRTPQSEKKKLLQNQMKFQSAKHTQNKLDLNIQYPIDDDLTQNKSLKVEQSTSKKSKKKKPRTENEMLMKNFINNQPSSAKKREVDLESKTTDTKQSHNSVSRNKKNVLRDLQSAAMDTSNQDQINCVSDFIKTQSFDERMRPQRGVTEINSNQKANSLIKEQCYNIAEILKGGSTDEYNPMANDEQMTSFKRNQSFRGDDQIMRSQISLVGNQARKMSGNKQKVIVGIEANKLYQQHSMHERDQYNVLSVKNPINSSI